MTKTITFQPGYWAFNQALTDAGLHLAMPPEWSRFWTKAKKGVVTLRLADSVLFLTAKFYDAVVTFERTSTRVTAAIDLSKRVSRDVPITRPPYGEVISAA